MTSPVAVVSLSEPQLDAAADVLAVAFHDDPLMRYVLPNAEQRAVGLPGHFRALLRYGRLFGDVNVTGGTPVAAAIWQPPGEAMTAERAEAAGMDEIPRSIGFDAAVRLGEVLDHLQPIAEDDVPGPHWYLMVVGVVPDERLHGVGRALLKPTIDRADAEGLPCYLVTFLERNVAFYTRLGFENLVEGTEPQSGLRFWTFRHDPPIKG